MAQIVESLRMIIVESSGGAIGLAAASLAGCSSMPSLSLDDYNPFAPEKYKTKIEEEVPPTAIYDQGLARLKKGDDDGAAKKFTDLGKQYPYSDWSKKGLLMTTYSQYRSEE